MFKGLFLFFCLNLTNLALAESQSICLQDLMNSMFHSENAELVKLEELQPLYDDVKMAYTKGFELREIKDELNKLGKLKSQTEVQLKRVVEIKEKVLELEDEITNINRHFLINISSLYEKEGIAWKSIQNENESLKIVLDFKAPASNKSAFEFYRKVHERFGVKEVSLSLKENAIKGSRGFFQPGSNRIEMGPNQGIQLLEDFFNSTSKHESRHAMFLNKRNMKKESIFHAQFFASENGDLLNADNFYNRYMSAEELYTFSTDLQSFAQVFKGESITDLKAQQALLEQINSKVSGLKKISKNSYALSDEMLKSLNETLLSSQKANQFTMAIELESGNWKFGFKDQLGRRAKITLVGFEDSAAAKKVVGLNLEIGKFEENYVSKMLREQGIDIVEFGQRQRANTLTNQESVLLAKLKNDAPLSVEFHKLQADLDLALIPLINHAKDKMTKFQLLANIQKNEAEKLEALLKNLSKTELLPSTKVEEIKIQLFKTAKNVKEDYKGFSLKDGLEN